MTHLRSIVDLSDATRQLTETALDDHLVDAREVNRENRITGVRLYNDGNIMQCLEGPDAAVEATDQRIRASPLRAHATVGRVGIRGARQDAGLRGLSTGVTHGAVGEGRPLSRPTCPLCGGPNRCGPVAADDLGAPCWCTRATFAPALLARVPEATRGVACLCAACAAMPDTAVA